MTPLAQLMASIFVVACISAVIAWVYGMIQFLPVWWALVRQRPPDRKRVKKTLIALGMFTLMVGLGLAAGVIADVFGGGW